MAKPTMRDMERVKRIGRYLVGTQRARWWFRWQHSGELEAYSDADWRGDKATRRSVSAGSSWEAHTASRCRPRNSKLWRCLQLRVSCTPRCRPHRKVLGIQSVAKHLGISCGLNLHLDASALMCLVNRRGLGKTKRVDMRNLWIQEASKSGRFSDEESRHERESRR